MQNIVPLGSTGTAAIDQLTRICDAGPINFGDGFCQAEEQSKLKQTVVACILRSVLVQDGAVSHRM